MNDISVIITTAIRQQIQEVKICNGIKTSEVRCAIRYIMRNNPDIFWFAHEYYYDENNSTIHFRYTFSNERVKFIQQSIDDVVENDFCINYVKKLSTQEQVAYVYKWLVSYCNYNTYSAYNQCIYSVFVRRNSVCTGYAKAAQYLFSLLGIESSLVFGRLHNDKEDGRHCWNLVKVDNLFYHFDSCFGDSILDEVAFKAGIQELLRIDGINYNFLCISTTQVLESRSIEDIETLPECPVSWTKDLVRKLSATKLRTRNGLKGCLLSNSGSTADIYLCTKDKNTVLKVYRPGSNYQAENEYRFMQQIRASQFALKYNEKYSNPSKSVIAMEQSTPIVDLLCSHYYKLTLKGLLRIAIDIAHAWDDCWRSGIVYRDIHICNIYRSNTGIFQLGDFGSCTHDIHCKEKIGNQWFIAPESFVSGIFTETSAVYSISMVIYFILNNLRPAFWDLDCENSAFQRRIDGLELPEPVGCFNLPLNIRVKLKEFFKSTLASLPHNRIRHIEQFIDNLEKLINDFENNDYTIHEKGAALEFVLMDGNEQRLNSRWNHMTQISNDMGKDTNHVPHSSLRFHNQYSESAHLNEIERLCLTVDKVENFCRTQASSPTPSQQTDWTQIDDVEKLCRTEFDPSPISNESDQLTDNIDDFAKERSVSDKGTTYIPNLSRSILNEDSSLYAGICTQKQSFWKGIFGLFAKKQKEKRTKTKQEDALIQDVYSSVFAPAEIRKQSHLMIQVYLHLYEETDNVKSLAGESDPNATRRDYLPLSLKLKKGDIVNLDLNIYGESTLSSKHKSVRWLGSFTKCSFDYFVSKDINVDELSCEIIASVNGAVIGEMRFITQIVETPRKLNPEVLSQRFNKIFISYSHKDESSIQFLALAYKAQGVNYFYDRHNLGPGDIQDEIIFDYIDQSDLFILCWSKNAAESDYVAKEKAHALLRAYPQIDRSEAKIKICPISIEPRADLPNDMKDIYNFEQVY